SATFSKTNVMAYSSSLGKGSPQVQVVSCAGFVSKTCASRRRLRWRSIRLLAKLAGVPDQFGNLPPGVAHEVGLVAVQQPVVSDTAEGQKAMDALLDVPPLLLLGRPHRQAGRVHDLQEVDLIPLLHGKPPLA